MQLAEQAAAWLQGAGHDDVHMVTPSPASSAGETWLGSCAIAVAPGCAAVLGSATEATPDCIQQLRCHIDNLRQALNLICIWAVGGQMNAAAARCDP